MILDWQAKGWISYRDLLQFSSNPEMPAESSLLHQNHPRIASGNYQEFVAQFAAGFVESSQRKTKQILPAMECGH